jgi:tetratricopeptide (TPR) repeat protein
MDKKKIFEILKIEETKDEKVIRDGYRKVLKTTNPEEKPEEFKLLRMAYEEALTLIKKDQTEEQTMEEESDIGCWIAEVDRAYKDLRKRANLDCWNELFSREICQGLDTFLEVREALLGFLMSHCYLPHEIWKYIDRIFNINADKVRLLETFPEQFIDYVVYYIENDTFLPYELFQYTLSDSEESNPDGYIQTYLEILSRLDSKNEEETDEIYRLLEQITGYGVYHPYEDVERIRLLLRKDDNEEAMKKAAELFECYPEYTYIKQIFAEVKFVLGDIETAVDIWKTIHEEDKKNLAAGLGLIQYYDKKSDYFYAKKMTEDMIKAVGIYPELLDYLGHFKKKMAVQYQEALDKGENIYEMSKGEMIYELCQCLLQIHKPEKVLQILEQYPIEEMSAYQRNYLFGYLYLVAEQHEKANDFLTNACETVSNPCVTIAYRLAMAIAFRQGKQYEKVIECCSEIIEMDLLCIPAYQMRQEACFYSERFQWVLYDYNILLEIATYYGKSYLLATQVFMAVEQYQSAKIILDKAEEQQVEFTPKMKLLKAEAIRYDGENAEEYGAQVLQILKELQREAKKFQDKQENRAWDIEDNSEITYELAMIQKEIQNYDKAYELFQQAIRQNPKRQQYHMGFGDWYYINGRLIEALQEFSLAKEEYENTSDYQYFVGSCEERMGNIDRAVEHYELGLALSPTFGYAAERTSCYYVDKYVDFGKKEYLEKALTYVEEQIEMRGEVLPLLMVRGFAYIAAYRFEEAKEDLRKAVTMEPEKGEAWLHLGRCNIYLEEYEKALGCFAKAKECFSDEDDIKRCEEFRALCYDLQGNYENAIQCLESVTGLLCLEQQKYLGDLYAKVSRNYMARKQYKLLNPIERYRSYIVHRIFRYGKTKKVFSPWAKTKYACGWGICRNRGKEEYYNGERGMTAFVLGKYREAGECFRLFLRTAQDMEERLEKCILAALCYQWCGKESKAEQYATEALELWKKHYPDKEEWSFYKVKYPKRLAEIAVICMCNGEDEQAMEYLELIAENKRCRDCKYKQCYRRSLVLAFLFERQKKYDKALEAYNETLKINGFCVQAVHGKKRLRRKGIGLN